MTTKAALLVFPPNWSACVSGPHLALPLLAGIGRRLDWHVETWDLSEDFYRTLSKPPSLAAIVSACADSDFSALDRLYFDWEDQLRSFAGFEDDVSAFGLLSGYPFTRFRSLSLAEAKVLVKEGTVYTSFFQDHVLPSLVKTNPPVIGITMASENQIVPTVELLHLIRRELPGTFLILGGNVVTRLRKSPAFGVLSSLVDQTVLFQGEMFFSRCLQAVGELGVEKARDGLPRVVSEEQIPYELWPIPWFNGIAFEHWTGIPVLPYVSTRGCYWGKCSFCAISAGWSTTGYGGSAPPGFVADQIVRLVMETGIPRVKFVDEAFPPSKVKPLSMLLRKLIPSLEWEAYARLEPVWGNIELLENAYAGGLRKLYFGLEQAPSTTRVLLGKNDRGDPLHILRTCKRVGIKVHLFCMVGYPGTTVHDARSTVRFLLENETLIDTADLVGFRLDRGTQVSGVRPVRNGGSDWWTSFDYEPTQEGILSFEEVFNLEMASQEELWEAAPRLLHPLYRVVGHWQTDQGVWFPNSTPKEAHECLASLSSMPR